MYMPLVTKQYNLVLAKGSDAVCLEGNPSLAESNGSLPPGL